MRSVRSFGTAASPSHDYQPGLVAALSAVAGAAIGAAVSRESASVTDGVLAGGFSAVLLWLAVHDVQTRRIPSRVVFPALGLAISVSWAWSDGALVPRLLAGGIVLLGGLVLPRGGIGDGDIKMAAFVGLLVGLDGLLFATIVAILAAGLTASVLLTAGRVHRGSAIAYAPFIAFGAITALLR